MFEFRVLKLAVRKGQNGHFKNVQKRGVKIRRPFLPSAVLNEIFLTDLSLNYDLANAQNPKFINYLF
jgi:hypothetical protein